MKMATITNITLLCSLNFQVQLVFSKSNQKKFHWVSQSIALKDFHEIDKVNANWIFQTLIFLQLYGNAIQLNEKREKLESNGKYEALNDKCNYNYFPSFALTSDCILWKEFFLYTFQCNLFLCLTSWIFST